MKTLVVYDSVYGGTEKIAKAIADAIGNDAEARRVGAVNPSDLKAFGLIIAGAPTNGGRPTPAMKDFLERVPTLAGTPVAAFDTRLTSKLVAVFGFAAGKIASSLQEKGGTLVAPPQGFFVKGKEGPLKDGELERAASWAREVLEGAK